MSIRGVICVGLLDSPSEIITLGLDSAEVTAPAGVGVDLLARLHRPEITADLRRPELMAHLCRPENTAELDT